MCDECRYVFRNFSGVELEMFPCNECGGIEDCNEQCPCEKERTQREAA